MAKYLALLRGINVGGKRKILMADLRALLEANGLNNPKTYIQSGNVIFESKRKLNPKTVEAKIKKAILDQYGFEVPTLVRTEQEWKNTWENNPYAKTGTGDIDIKRLHLTFLADLPTSDAIEQLKEFQYPPDKYERMEKDVYICCEGSYRDCKYTNTFFEKKLKVSATTRNWKTVTKLMEMLEQ